MAASRTTGDMVRRLDEYGLPARWLRCRILGSRLVFWVLMRRVLIFVLVVLMGAVIVPAAGARLSEKHICKVHRCTTIAATSACSRFRSLGPAPVRELKEYEVDEVEYRVDFAVWRPTGKVTELANGTTYQILEAQPYVREATIAGPYVAYRVAGFVEGRYNPLSLPEEIDRLDARTGRRTVTPKVSVETECKCLFFATTTNGTVAWSFKEGPQEESAVDVLPAGSSLTTRLARSQTVEPASLALVPGHIYWLEGGVPRTFAAP